MSNEPSALSGIAVDSFYRFLNEVPPSEFPKGLRLLADYIQAWLESGHGIDACEEDRQKFLVQLAALIHLWHERPGLLDYVPTDDDGDFIESAIVRRRVTSIFSADMEAAGHPILDPGFFDQCVRKHRARRRRCPVHT